MAGKPDGTLAACTEMVSVALQKPATAGMVAHGRRFPPQQQILLFSADDWEGFIEEWVHYQQSRYAKVVRMSGAGDMGIDVAGLADEAAFQGVWDNYQCKHYDDPLTPATAVPEIGKCLWHAFDGAFVLPRRYYFMAPKDCGAKLKRLLLDAGKLKSFLYQNWDKWCATVITKKQTIALEGAFNDFVSSVDFSRFTFKTALEAIDEHRQTPHHAARFGGGLPERPEPETPPHEAATHESRYLQKLLDAYADHKRLPVTDAAALTAWPPLERHYRRQREYFYHAEALRNFARDNVPAGTFENLQDEVHAGVIEIEESSAHADAMARVDAVTQAATSLSLTANGLIEVTKVQDRRGICHQLANEDRLTWRKT